MKKILIVLAAAITIASCKEADKTAEATTTTSTAPATETLTPAPNTAAAPQQNTVDPATLTKVEWLDGMDKDFGKMKEGENLEVSFHFKNTGKKPLVISKVCASCGCTVPETPKSLMDRVKQA